MENEFAKINSIEQYVNELSLAERLVFGFNISFSKCICERRKELGWTQATLAEKSGVNLITITNLEGNKRTASIEVVLKLLYALGMSIEFVLQKD